MGLGEKITAAFWSLLALFVVFYGSGEFDLITLVLYDYRLNRWVHAANAWSWVPHALHAPCSWHGAFSYQPEYDMACKVQCYCTQAHQPWDLKRLASWTMGNWE